MKLKLLLILVVIAGILVPAVSAWDYDIGLYSYTTASARGGHATTEDTWSHTISNPDWQQLNGGQCSIYASTTTNKWNNIIRQVYVFDTSSVPTGKVITEAVLYCDVSTNNDASEWGGMDFIWSTWSPSDPTTRQLSDYQPDKFGGIINESTVGTYPSDKTYLLDETELNEVFNPDGYTCIAVMLEPIYTGIAPAWGSAYQASLSFSNPATTKLKFNVGDAMTASISPDVSSGNAPLEVTFTDASDGFPEVAPYDEYHLSFGDGSYWDGEWQYTGETWFHTYYYAGTYNYSYEIVDDGTSYYSDGTITVGESTSNYYVEVHGLDTSPISGANVTIWYNGELQDWEGTSGIGRSYFDVPANRWVNGTVSKPGYQTASYNQYISTWDTWTTLTLYADNETPGTGDEYWNYIVTFRDASTLATLTNVFIDVYTDSGRTDLFTSENAPYGVWTGLLPNDTTFYFTVSAENHLDLEWSYTLSGASVSVYKDMIPISYGSLQPVLNIFVYDTYGHPLNGASVTVDSDIDDGFHLTNITGYARHFCDNLAYESYRDYTITASMGGYSSETSVVNVSTQQPVIYIFLDKSIYGSVTQTGVYTPVVTPVWSGDGGTPGNIKEQLINALMTQFGVSQLEANILMGIILTILCAVVVGGALASYGSGSGAGVGAMIGAVVGFSGSSIIGFLPIWILIVVIVLVFAAWFMFRGRDE